MNDADAYVLERRVALYDDAMPAVFRGVTLDDFTAEIAAKARAWSDDASGTLMVVGTKGVGKTQLVLCLGRELTAAGARVGFCPVKQLVNLAGDSMRGDRAATETIRRYAAHDVLILDDIGDQRVTDFTRDVCADLIDQRWRNQLPIVSTTNVTAEAILDCVGERAASRLWHNATVIAMDGNDRRARATTPTTTAGNGKGF